MFPQRTQVMQIGDLVDRIAAASQIVGETVAKKRFGVCNADDEQYAVFMRGMILQLRRELLATMILMGQSGSATVQFKVDASAQENKDEDTVR